MCPLAPGGLLQSCSLWEEKGLSFKNLLLKGQRTVVPQGDPQVFTGGSCLKKSLLYSLGLLSPKAGPLGMLVEFPRLSPAETSLRRSGLRPLQKALESPLENSTQISSKGFFFDCGTIYSLWQGFKAFRAQLLKLYELIAHPAHQLGQQVVYGC